jgi:hypothetical protein
MAHNTEIEKIPILHFSNEEIEVRKKVIYCMLTDMGISLEPLDVTKQMVYALRFIPVHQLMAGFVVKKLTDGYSSNQIVRKYPVTRRQYRTIMEKRRTFREKLLEKTEIDTSDKMKFSV